MYTHLVIGGGGIKGIAVVGALKIINKHSPLEDFTHFIGSSVGGLISFFLCIGYNHKELYEIMLKIDFNRYKETTITKLFENFGVDDGIQMKRLIIAIAKQKNIPADITFKELHEKTGKTLVVTGSNLTTNTCIYYSHETTPDYKVIDAVRITISYPILFNPIKEGDSVIMDGAVLDPYPINYYDVDTRIGIAIHNRNPANKIHSFEEYVVSLIKCFINNYEKLHINTYEKHTIFIELPQIYSMKLDINIEDKLSMYRTGIKSSQEYFNHKNLTNKSDDEKIDDVVLESSNVDDEKIDDGELESNNIDTEIDDNVDDNIDISESMALNEMLNSALSQIS